MQRPRHQDYKGRPGQFQQDMRAWRNFVDDNPGPSVPDNVRKALIQIAMLHDSKEYPQVTKTDLWEALKYCRHMAKCALNEIEPHREWT